MNSIDINCDMGESDSIEGCHRDIELMPYISQCNIAVGGHIGNPDTIAFSFIKAAEHNLKIGLHPSYPDRANFGRSRQSLSIEDLNSSLTQQIDDALAIAEQLDVKIQHIKFHGQLYNDLETDHELRHLVLKLMQNYPDLALMGLAEGELLSDSKSSVTTFIREAFADRAYIGLNRLQPRSEAGAVIKEADIAAKQALAIAKNQQLTLVTGETALLNADTLCVHSDTPNAMAILQTINDTLNSHGISVG